MKTAQELYLQTLDVDLDHNDSYIQNQINSIKELIEKDVEYAISHTFEVLLTKEIEKCVKKKQFTVNVVIGNVTDTVEYSYLRNLKQDNVVINLSDVCNDDKYCIIEKINHYSRRCHYQGYDDYFFKYVERIIERLKSDYGFKVYNDSTYDFSKFKRSKINRIVVSWDLST